MESLLKQMRTRRGETTYQLAGKFKMAQSEYSRLENGERSVSPELREAIATHFEVKPELLFDISLSRYVVAGADTRMAEPVAEEKAS